VCHLKFRASYNRSGLNVIYLTKISTINLEKTADTVKHAEYACRSHYKNPYNKRHNTYISETHF